MGRFINSKTRNVDISGAGISHIETLVSPFARASDIETNKAIALLRGENVSIPKPKLDKFINAIETRYSSVEHFQKTLGIAEPVV